MTPELPPSLRRLAQANPAPIESSHVREPAAQALLERILATPRNEKPRMRRLRSPRLIAIAVTAGLLATGGAVAATDPFGFWRSATPGTAMYGVDYARHVRTLTIPVIGCRPAGGTLHCGAQVRAQRYQLIDTVRAQPVLTRARVAAAIATSRQLTPTQRRQFKADLAAVSDGFLARVNLAMHFATYSAGEVPPSSVPVVIACQPAGSRIVCEDMNGDEAVPVGSAIYGGIPGPGWREQSQSGAQPSMAMTTRMMNAVFGGPLTAAENRFFRDIMMAAGSGQSRSSSHNVPPPAP